MPHFLFQIIFFGLFACAISVATENTDWKSAALALQQKFKGESPADVQEVVDAMPHDAQRLKDALANEEATKRLAQHFGASDLTELTDELTRMAPIAQLRSANKLIQKAGTVERANDAVERYLKSGVGKPACLLADATKNGAKPLATVIGYEDHLEFKAETPELSAVLIKLGTDYAAVRSLPLAQFKHVFSRLGTLYPDCVYTFNLIEKTRYVEPRDAATANWNVRVIPRRG
ncbi:UNVERIFIED_ORG: hypothetical protein ABIC62_005674 [Burkholderia sp. 1595]|uniref:Uncharacterized protein n=1 Tax=Paraburkholderia terricola TaxID=169427 RepID=A0ABU1M0J0_9BURK|nr:hypothetical protein [Paraburkholderia terricola]MDR6412250.1 hypothetical protein [Paraburkholderia terricola]